MMMYGIENIDEHVEDLRGYDTGGLSEVESDPQTAVPIIKRGIR